MVTRATTKAIMCQFEYTDERAISSRAFSLFCMPPCTVLYTRPRAIAEPLRLSRQGLRDQSTSSATLSHPQRCYTLPRHVCRLRKACVKAHIGRRIGCVTYNDVTDAKSSNRPAGKAVRSFPKSSLIHRHTGGDEQKSSAIE